MANSTIPGLVAVTVPAGTDLLGVRQSGDARDKKLTVTQLLSLAPGGGDVTKVGTPVNNQLGIWTGDGTIEGVPAIQYDGTTFTMNLGGNDLRLTGKLELQGSNRPAVLDEAASLTNATLAPLGNSPASGIGGGGTSVSVVANSLAGMVCIALGGGVFRSYETSRTLTAFAGGGQASATPIINSNSIITTVATTGDSVKLTTVSELGAVFFIKNDGANACDVFPGSGKDIGAGVDTAISLAAGTSVSYVNTGSSNMTAWIVSPSGGNVFKVGTPVNNQLGVWTGDGTIEGDSSWQVVGSALQGVLGSGPEMRNVAGVNIHPRKGDTDTGIASRGDNRLAMVAQGVDGIKLIGASTAILQQHNTIVGLTAFAGGGQGSATQLNASYSVIDTVATTGDSVKFSTTLEVGVVNYVKNDGANAMDLFPAAGDDLGNGVGVAISVPAGKSVAFIGTVVGSTSTQFIFEDGVSFPLLAPDGDATDPSYSFASDSDTGFFLSNPATIEVTTAGVSHFEFINTGFGGKIASGPRMLDEAPTATNPNLVPNKADTDSGIGQIAANTVSFIAGGAEAFRATFAGGGRAIFAAAAGPLASGIPPITVVSDLNTGIYFPAADQMTLHVGGVDLIRLVEGAADQVIVAPTLQDAAATPSLAFGDGDTGIYESIDDTLKISLAGVARWTFTGDSLVAVVGNGPRLMNEGSLHDNPTLIPALGDPGTGIGGVTGDISLIVGGVERLRITSALGIFTGDWQASNSTGPLIIDEAASGINPTLAPHRGDEDTGIGRVAADQLSLIAGAVEGFRVTEAAAVITNTLFGQLIANAAGGPALQNEAATFNNPSVLPNKTDDDTGIGYGGSDVLDLIAGASNRVRLTSGDSVFRGDWNANTSSGPALLDEGASSSNPTIVPNQADDDTGIGRDAVDSLAFIAGGVSCMRVREIAAAPAVGFYTTTPIVQQTGVAVTDVAIHAALVALGLITA